MAAPDTSMYPPIPAMAERPGLDDREHPSAPDAIAYLSEVQRVIIEATGDEFPINEDSASPEFGAPPLPGLPR
ncbi:MAG: hypothetical protein JWQ07_311 [Ramlibacter sp.]|nr:hypothetical protein [Ramlibacter sp.]